MSKIRELIRYSFLDAFYRLILIFFQKSLEHLVQHGDDTDTCAGFRLNMENPAQMQNTLIAGQAQRSTLAIFLKPFDSA